MADQPQNMSFGFVHALVAIGLLLAQPEAQRAQPLVICQTGTSPDRARMLHVGSFVGSLVRFVGMRRIQQLGGLQDHLDDMFVAVLFGRPPWVSGQYEDIHQNSIRVECCVHFPAVQ